MTDHEHGARAAASTGEASGEPFDGPASLSDLVDEALADLSAVERRLTDRTTLLGRAGRPFGAATEDVLEVRLDPLVTAAALRTPDTSPSDRGPGWISFAPRELDRYAVDRATAWLEYGWRHALD
jgi:hypothetical protein